MKTLWKWLPPMLAALLGVIFLSLFGMPLFIPPAPVYRAYGMMAGWRMPMHEHFGGGWLPMLPGGVGLSASGMLLSGVVEVGALVLGVAVIIWLLRSLDRYSQGSR